MFTAHIYESHQYHYTISTKTLQIDIKFNMFTTDSQQVHNLFKSHLTYILFSHTHYITGPVLIMAITQHWTLTRMIELSFLLDDLFH
jgi:hypothetical protein